MSDVTDEDRTRASQIISRHLELIESELEGLGILATELHFDVRLQDPPGYFGTPRRESFPLGPDATVACTLLKP